MQQDIHSPGNPLFSASRQILTPLQSSAPVDTFCKKPVLTLSSFWLPGYLGIISFFCAR